MAKITEHCKSDCVVLPPLLNSCELGRVFLSFLHIFSVSRSLYVCCLGEGSCLCQTRSSSLSSTTVTDQIWDPCLEESIVEHVSRTTMFEVPEARKYYFKGRAGKHRHIWGELEVRRKCCYPYLSSGKEWWSCAHTRHIDAAINYASGLPFIQQDLSFLPSLFHFNEHYQACSRLFPPKL